MLFTEKWTREVLSMARINLKADNLYEKAILEYLENNASDALVEKINSSDKTLKGCMAFVKGEAQKEAQNGMAMIEDKVVFGWAVHFFEEDAIKEGAKPEYTGKIIHTDTLPKKKPEKKAEPKEEEPQLKGQMDIFSFLN